MPDLAFRPVAETDRQRLLAWRNSPDVARYMYTDHVVTADEHARWFGNIGANPGRAYWIIEVDGQPVGLVNLYDIDTEQGRASWAYYLAEPSTRGKGIGSAVEYHIIEHVFGDRGLRKLWCEVLAENEAVWKLHLVFGFRQEALFRAHVVKGGRPLDVVGLGLLREDWPAARHACAAKVATKGFDLSAPSGL